MLVLRWLSHGLVKDLKSNQTDIEVAWLKCDDLSSLPEIETAMINRFVPDLNKREAELAGLEDT